MRRSPRYSSQWGDLACNHAVIERREDPATLHDWRADGYASAEEYRRWSLNTCGIACLQSVLSDLGHPEQPKTTLLRRAVATGALVPQDDGGIDGMFYRPFVEWVRADYGIEAVVRGVLEVDELSSHVASGDWYVIASVSSEIRWPDRRPSRRGGHLVLVHDIRDGHLIFHNPSGLGPTAADARCRPERFAHFFARRGILVKRSPCGSS
ncbi:C39 family peptidase [Cellulomonas sp. PS-H5]|nr:C39 family peptidase [Cellulomonas sp. PS-H5]